MNKKNALYLSGLTIAAVIGVALIVGACHDNSQPQQQGQVDYGQQQQQQPGQPPVVIVQEQPQEHFWQDVMLYHFLFGGSSQTTHVHVYQPAPVYRPVPVVNKVVNVTNVNVSKTVNVTQAAPVVAPKPAVVQPQQKSAWFATPSQVVKASTNYPKASNITTGGYSPRPSYTPSRTSYSSGSSSRRK
jgi:hypothetical protein